MSFAGLNGEFVDLRSLVRSVAGNNALGEISVRPPTSDDEASFLRLIAWSYALIFEAGRITIPYLLKLPSSVAIPEGECETACRNVHDLRTWTFHNLGYDSERDVARIRRVHTWFMDRCEVSPPDNAADWSRCFDDLCKDVHGVTKYCKGAVSLLLDESEYNSEVIADLNLRCDRNWPVERFDGIVADAAIRLGKNVNIPSFRQHRINRWRQFLESVPEADNPRVRIVRLIERDLLDHFEGILPIDGNDVMNHIGLAPGPAVGDLLMLARRLYDAGVDSKRELLDALTKHSAS